MPFPSMEAASGEPRISAAWCVSHAPRALRLSHPSRKPWRPFQCGSAKGDPVRKAPPLLRRRMRQAPASGDT
ncbi:hypothetical protein [Lysobacter gummosus]|uniref:hypothetical protein n=1 Tax=Lysobacter gummosus TaxID=262324 RepID=UPI003631904E